MWRALDDPAIWEGIGGVDRVYDPVIDDQGHLRGFSFDTLVGGRPYRGRATPRDRVEGITISWNIDSGEIRGVTSVDLEEEYGDTAVTVTVAFEVSGMLSTLFFPVISAAIGNGLPEAVERFAESLANAR